jgi:histidinol dehydrogenase
LKVHRLYWNGDDARLFAGELRALAPSADEVAADVAATLLAVGRRGDEALVELAREYDGVELRLEELRVEPAALDAAAEGLAPELVEALTLAAGNIRTVAEAQLGEEPILIELPQGQEVAVRELPVTSAGMYVPGGRAPYPSSALMCCIPALVAGVQRVAVASSPGPDGRPSPVVLAACAIAGADEVYAIGGAQAIAALALGTESVHPVDLIAGPGNRYVQEAKRQLAGRVGIDGIAGPSELMVIFDRGAELEWVALDLCAQGEHGADGLLAAAAADGGLLSDLAERVRSLAAERPSVSEPPLALVEVPNVEAAIALADALAPEHLQLMCEGAEAMAGRVRTAGCVFVGTGGSTAFGDYAAGSNHVLPTGGAGRFTGPLGPDTFRRKQSVVTVPGAAASSLAAHVDVLARAEGFPVHAESARARGTG